MTKWLSGRWRWTILGTIAVTGGSAFLLYFQVEEIKKNLKPQLPVLRQEKNRSYLYLRSENFAFVDKYKWGEKGINQVVTEMQNYIINHTPPRIAKLLPPSLLKQRELTAQRYISPWQLLQEVSTPSPELLQDVIDKISNHKWMEYEYRLLGQNLSPSYIFALARTKGVDERFFTVPKQLRNLDDESVVEYLLYDMLMKLPQHDVESCLRYFTQGALMISDERQLKKGGMWCFGGNGINYTREIVPQEKVESFCLQALVKHSKIASHCEAMVDQGILELLQRIHILRPNALKIQRNCVRIISNICVHEELHPYILASGWLWYLVKMSKSELLPMRMQASKALANLDRKYVEEKYLDGVYLIHPRHRTENDPAVDIVLIHGLLGGAFHTWRQQEIDSVAVADYTSCWPESWLPQDLPNVRVVSVEYDTHLSDWMSHCPHEKETRTISFRSQQILEKLKTAGIGQKRPVVWIAHSMGGLVLKNMLLIADDKKDEYQKIVENTRGIIFYSTPHFGSQLAEYSRKVRKLLFPSVEVMALSHDSPQLRDLNDEFKNLAQVRDIKVLNFGELQSTSIGVGKVKLHIVPPESADPGVGTVVLCDSNHLNICKPVSRHSMVYRQTINFVQSCLQNDEGKDIFARVDKFLAEAVDSFLR